MSVVLDLQALSFGHAGEPALLSNWSAAIGHGLTHLYGDTGAGKTTLLRVIAGQQPASGRLAIMGTRLDQDAVRYRQQLFFCDASSEDVDPATVLGYTASLRQGDPAFDEDLWQALVEGFALTPHLAKPMFMLSTGSRRKVGLAAALASGRALVLLDEPAAALDAGSVRRLWEALARRADTPGRAVLIASSTRDLPVALAGVIDLPAP